MIQWKKKIALAGADSSDQIKRLACPGASGLTFLQLIQGRDLVHAVDGEDEADPLR